MINAQGRPQNWKVDGLTDTGSVEDWKLDVEMKSVVMKLKEYLKNHAHEAGFQKEDIEKFQNPVLIREVEVEDKSKRFGISLTEVVDGAVAA